jgi:hypothetical protein
MGASLAEPFPLCQTPMAVGPNSAPPTALLCAQLGPEVPAWRIASADTRSNRFCGGFLGPKLPHARLLHLRNRELQYPTGKKKSKAKPSLANLTQLLVPGFVSPLTPSH